MPSAASIFCVNNAALMAELGYLQAVDIPIEQWNRIMDVNVTGALNCVQAIVPLMRAAAAARSSIKYPPAHIRPCQSTA